MFLFMALNQLVLCSLFPVQQTTSGIGHLVSSSFFRVGNQYAECEQQQRGCSEGLGAFRFFFKQQTDVLYHKKCYVSGSFYFFLICVPFLGS